MRRCNCHLCRPIGPRNIDYSRPLVPYKQEEIEVMLRVAAERFNDGEQLRLF